MAEKRLLEALRSPSSSSAVTRISFNIVLSGYALQSSWGDRMSPPRAEALLSKLLQSQHLQADTYTFNTVMEAWAKSRLPRARNAVMRLFGDMQQLGIQPDTYTYDIVMSVDVANAERWVGVMTEQQPPVQPDRQTYNLLFKSYALSGESTKAEELLRSLLDRAEKGEENLQPNRVWINNVINAHGKSKQPDSKRADYWLRQMKIWNEEGNDDLRPDASTYNQVMNVHATLGHTKRVLQLLEELEHRHETTGDRALLPDKVSYTTAIKAQSNNPKAADLLLRRMEDWAVLGRPKIHPSIVTYTTVIHIWAATNTREGLKRGMEILRSMPVEPNSSTYAELIYGWSRGGFRESGHRAHTLLTELEALRPSRQRGVEICKLYNAVILAWSRSGDPESPQRAEALLDLLEQKYARGDPTACPSLVTFVSVSDAYAKASVPNAREKCEELLERMAKLRRSGVANLQPSRILYNSILNALAKSCRADSVEKAEEILAQMQACEDDGMQPDIVTYATVLDCYTKSGMESYQRAEEILALVEDRYAKGNDQLKPNAVFYSAILQAWAKSSSPAGARRALDLLRRNERLYEQEGQDFCKPHAIMYNAVMDAIARSGRPNSGHEAEGLLQEMEEKYQAGDGDFRPTRRSLNAVMLAYRHDVDGGQKAEKVLRRMEELTEAGVYDVMPDVVAYNCAIGAIAGSDDPTAADRAQALLDRMVELHSQGDKFVRPDGKTYSRVIDAWLRRNDQRGGQMAQLLLDRFFGSADFKNDKTSTNAVLDVVNAYNINREEERLTSDDDLQMPDFDPKL